VSSSSRTGARTRGSARTARAKIEMRKETRTRKMPKACVANPWYKFLGAVFYHWFLVRDASQWAEHAVGACRPVLIQSSDGPHVGLYGAQKVVLNGSTRKKNGMRLVLLSIAFVWLAEQPVSSR